MENPSADQRWGPIADLAHNLAMLMPTRHDRWNKGMWNAVIWDLLGDEPEPSPGVGFWNPTEWFDALFGTRERTAPRLESHAFAEAIIKCQTWLARQNANYLVPYFSPFWRDMPLELIAVSEKAVVWAVYAYVVDYCTDRKLRQKLRTSAGMLERFCGVGPGTPIGDLVSLHVSVERLTAEVARKHCPRTPPHGNRNLRRPGGLRRREFLIDYSRLRLVAAPEVGGSRPFLRRLEALDRLIDGSPLTRVVYADLVTRGDSLAQARAFQLDAESNGFVPLVEFAPSNPDAAYNSPRRGWRELWISLLAKSLVGAALSAGPALDRRLLLEIRHRDRLAQYDHRVSQLAGSSFFGSPKRHPVLDGRCQRLQAEMNELVAGIQRLRDVERNQRWMRFVVYHAIMASSREKAIMASSYLQVRFLDMLVRHLVAANTRAINEQWRRLDNLHETQRRHAIFSTEDGVVTRAFAEVFFGQPISELRQALRSLNQRDQQLFETQRLQQAQAELASGTGSKRTFPREMVLDHFEWFEFQCNSFLDVRNRCGDLDLSDPQQWPELAARWHRDVGVTEEAAERLVRRFVDDDAGVEVTFQGHNPNSYSPATLLAAWTGMLGELASAEHPSSS